MPDPMKPALTAEEWASEIANTYFPLEDRMWWAADEADLPYGGHRHALAALALHGQPFGFNDEDRAMLYLFADTLGARGVHESHVARCKSLADRIAALLPPEPAP